MQQNPFLLLCYYFVLEYKDLESKTFSLSLCLHMMYFTIYDTCFLSCVVLPTHYYFSPNNEIYFISSF